MITNISNAQTSFEPIKQVLLHAAQDFRPILIYRQVSKSFKSVADNPSFLHDLLCKLKGSQYQNSCCIENPRNFFIFERDLLTSLKNRMEDQNLRAPSSVAIESLHKQSLRFVKNASPYHFRLSDLQFQTLCKDSCMNRKNWAGFIHTLTDAVSEWNFPKEHIFRLKDEQVSRFEYIEEVYHNPNMIMKEMIKNHNIKDLYFADSNLFIVQADSETLTSLTLQECDLIPEKKACFTTIRQMNELFDSLRISRFIDGIPSAFAISNKNQIKQISAQIKTQEKSFKEDIEATFSTIHHQFLLGYFFPEIWPNLISNLGQKNIQCAIMHWTLEIFVKSIAKKYDNKGLISGIVCDREIYQYLRLTLADPSSGLKEFIEQKYKTRSIFQLFKTCLFPGVFE